MNVISPTKELMIEARKLALDNLNKMSRLCFLYHYQIDSDEITVAQSLKIAEDIEFKELLNKNG